MAPQRIDDLRQCGLETVDDLVERNLGEFEVDRKRACSETNPDPARVGRSEPGEILGDQGIRLQRQQHRAGRHPAGGHRVEQEAGELHRVGQVTGEVCVMLAHHDAVVPDLAGSLSLATQHLNLVGRREVVRIEP